MHQDLTRSLGQKPQALGGPKGFLFLVTSVIANPTSLLHFCPKKRKFSSTFTFLIFKIKTNSLLFGFLGGKNEWFIWLLQR